jgi:hypothetical protein
MSAVSRRLMAIGSAYVRARSAFVNDASGDAAKNHALYQQTCTARTRWRSSLDYLPNEKRAAAESWLALRVTLARSR